MKKILVMSLMVLISYVASATEIIYHDLGKVQQLDTNSRTNYRVHIKFKGKTYKKATANFYLVYIKEN